jgi:hypothetical protein
MLERVQRIRIPSREQLEPGRDLALIAEERTQKAMEEGRKPALDQKSEPGDHYHRYDEKCPGREHEVMRDDERGSKHHDRPTPAQ